jgi:hypothetical protein
MSIDDGISGLVLQEFRLHAADTTGEAARIVAAFSSGLEPPVPLLTSIDDRRDVATVRALHQGETAEGGAEERAALEPLVANWQPLKEYGPRITERSDIPPSYYRLAVTESGINNAEPDPDPGGASPGGLSPDGHSTRLGLLWIGLPLGTYSGMLTLLGSDDDRATVRPDPRAWPLPLSRPLGVRIYESRR